MSDWPDHASELARKSMSRIVDAIDRYQTNGVGSTILKETVRLMVTADVLSEVTQGLIDNESWNTIYAVRQEMRQKIRDMAK